MRRSGSWTEVFDFLKVYDLSKVYISKCNNLILLPLVLIMIGRQYVLIGKFMN